MLAYGFDSVGRLDKAFLAAEVKCQIKRCRKYDVAHVQLAAIDVVEAVEFRSVGQQFEDTRRNLA